MKRTFFSFFIVALLVIAPLGNFSIAFADEVETPAAEQLADDNNHGVGHHVVRGTGMCVGGAIVGSVVPLFGTIIGCGIGVAYAWFSAD